jgi:arsenate reductase (glutaredoxin)
LRQQIVGVAKGAGDMTTIIYGIKNCDTMKKARNWLASHKIVHDFHDYKAAGIDQATLQGWVKKVGWQGLINRAGTTFRRLADADKADITEKKAIALMLAQPSMIRRPVLDTGGRLTVGFDPKEYEKLFDQDA